MNKIVASIKEMMPLIEEKLKAGGEASITVKGTSMSPFFVNGKTIVTLQKPKEEYDRFDVVLYETEAETYVLHRIVRVKGDFLTIEGDGLRKIENVGTRSVRAVVKSHQNGDTVISADDKHYLRQVRRWHLLRPLRRILLHFWFHAKGK